jgi:hypothetical protein
MVEILRGEFVKSHELSNLTEKQGNHRVCFQRFNLRRGRAIDSSQRESLDLVVDFHFRGFMSQSPEIFASGFVKL